MSHEKHYNKLIMALNTINKTLNQLLDYSLGQLELNLDSDVMSYTGPIVNGLERDFLRYVEKLSEDENKRSQLAVLLTTNGGSATAVERFVNILRKHYQKVIFIIPDYAYSAGTIFAMSGDEIWMDYYSVLGPIDPQVTNKEGRFVPALGYLDKVNELIAKAQQNKLTQAEFLILKDFDLAELRGYEQAKELTVSLLKKWLVKYKFKNWQNHASTGEPVTLLEKEKRAEEIADALGDNKKWKSHGRPINIEELEELKLQIKDYSDEDVRKYIIDYYDLLSEYVSSYKINVFLHTRKSLPHEDN